MEASYIRTEAVNLLIDTKVDRIPIDPFEIATTLNIPIATFREAQTVYTSEEFSSFIKKYKPDAFCCSPAGSPIIFYDDTVKNKGRIRFSIAHELGHIALKHINVTSIMPRREGSHSKEEQEADIFAAELLMPQCLLFCTRTYKRPFDIKDRFKVSLSAAKARSAFYTDFNVQRYTTKLEDTLINQIKKWY